jgi:D-alanyl-D-alanine carboxypeptidase
MSRRLSLASLLVVAACGGAPAVPTPPPVGDHGVAPANLTAQLPPYLDALSGFSGFVLVAQHDQILFEHAYGFADAMTRRVATADTSFRIGSVTKQFTSAAILQLEQAGKLSVTDTVGKLLPDYAGPGKDVTVHQLLTHTAGIPDYTQNDALMEKRADKISPQEILHSFWEQPLEFAPGSQHKYSNSGYIILGLIIEKISGEPYAQYVTTHLFAPAKLERTVVGDAIGTADRAEGYGRDKQPAHPIDMSVPYAAGAIRSTARDLVRWHRALSGDAILSAAERAKLYQPALDKYAYGWVVDEVAGHAVVWHNGGIDGFGTSYWRVPDADLVVVAWTNIGGFRIDPVAKAAVEAALGGKLTPATKDQAGTLDTALVERMVGTYTLDDEGKATLTKLGASPKVIEAVATMEIAATPVSHPSSSCRAPMGASGTPRPRSASASTFPRAARSRRSTSSSTSSR